MILCRIRRDSCGFSCEGAYIMFHRDGFVQVDGAGQILPEEIRYDLSNRISGSTPIAAQLTIADGPSNLQVPGNLDGTEGGDVYGFNLTAGVTYSFAERPAAQGGIIDPLMAIFDSSFNFIAMDDDGCAG